MGFDEGRLVLNSDNGTYFPGQILSGKLEFNQDKIKKFRGIYVEIKGKCKVHWTTKHTRRVNDRTEHYTVTHESYEEYVNITIYLVGSKSGEQTLHPGHHVFPFECQIPPHCPSSFEGSVGSVRYKVKVTVDRAFKTDQTKEAVFRVIAPLNLNDNPVCKDPLEMHFEQTFCCWCMNSGMAETLIKLPARGWCPGQIIPIEVACNNASSEELDTLRFSIIKTISFEAVSKPDYRSEEETIAEIKKGPVPANTTRNWTVEMEVPDMDVPNLGSCRFITVAFRFKVSIETGACHTDEDESHDIFIGTIPLVGLQYGANGMETPQNTLGVNQFPAAPIINQPVAGYPNGTPYPGPNQPYPGSPNVGFSPQNTPYPAPNVTPYPGNMGPNQTPQNLTNAPYPMANSGTPYPSNTPYQNPYQPYPPSNSPYPPNPSFSPSYAPYPPPVTPYPAPNPPYPGNPAVTESNLLKTGNMGFTKSNEHSDSIPLLPPGVVPRPASPFVSASAPASTPDQEKKEDKVPPPYPQ